MDRLRVSVPLTKALPRSILRENFGNAFRNPRLGITKSVLVSLARASTNSREIRQTAVILPRRLRLPFDFRNLACAPVTGKETAARTRAPVHLWRFASGHRLIDFSSRGPARAARSVAAGPALRATLPRTSKALRASQRVVNSVGLGVTFGERLINFAEIVFNRRRFIDDEHGVS